MRYRGKFKQRTRRYVRCWERYKNSYIASAIIREVVLDNGRSRKCRFINTVKLRHSLRDNPPANLKDKRARVRSFHDLHNL